MKKEKFIALAIFLTMLSGCVKGGTEGGAVTSAEVTAAGISETFTESTTAASEAATASVSETETAAITDKTESPTVVLENEVCGVYPRRINYPAFAPTEAIYTIETRQEDIYTRDGLKAAEFYAEYPVIFGCDKAVCEKINGALNEYIESYSEMLKSSVKSRKYDWNETELMKDNAAIINEYKVSVYGVEFEGDVCDVNGNIFSVYFSEYGYSLGAAHGSEKPKPMLFDLRTGERVFFSDLVGDMEGLSRLMNKTLFDYLYTRSSFYDFCCGDPNRYEEYLKMWENEKFSEISEAVKFGIDKDGNCIAALWADDRMTVWGGAVGFYLAPYEYGSYGDGIRRIDVAAEDIYPYLNEKGRSLFEGYQSAESEPANIIEENGEKRFNIGFNIG